MKKRSKLKSRTLSSGALNGNGFLVLMLLQRFVPQIRQMGWITSVSYVLVLAGLVAVFSSSRVLNVSGALVLGLGASSIISFAKGRRDEKQANRVFTSTFIVLIALSVIFIAIQLPLADSISSLLTKDAELKSLLYQYYVPFIIGTPNMSKR